MRDRPSDPVDVLLVEDNPGDVRLTREALAEETIATELHVARDGEEALDFLYRRGEHADAVRPDLVLLDLNLPKVDGLEVLDEVKDDPDLRRIPVVVLSGSAAETDVRRGYESHANAYLTKPVDPGSFLSLVRSVAEFWSTVVRLPPGGD